MACTSTTGSADQGLITHHTPPTATVAIALGSNLGDRRAHLEYGVDRLRHILKQMRCSEVIPTEPVDVGEQPEFLNAAVVGVFIGEARDLLNQLLRIERDRGRQRPFPGAPRTLDLDLILFGDRIVEEPDLTIPHPRFRDRIFVLQPLAEIGPDLIDPVTGQTVRELWERRKIAN